MDKLQKYNNKLLINNNKLFKFDPPIYNVTILPSEHGTVYANPVSGYTGTTVTLSNTPDTDYRFDGYTISGATLYDGNKFNLFKSDVTVQGNFSNSGYKYFLFIVYKASESRSDFMQQDFGLFDANNRNTRITGFTTLAGRTSSNPSTENYPNGFDGNMDTKWYSNNTWPNWAIFTKDIFIDPVGFSYGTSNDQSLTPTRAPIKYKLYGSNTSTTDKDDASWELIYEINNDTTFSSVTQNKVWVDKYFA